MAAGDDVLDSARKSALRAPLRPRVIRGRPRDARPVFVRARGDALGIVGRALSHQPYCSDRRREGDEGDPGNKSAVGEILRF